MQKDLTRGERIIAWAELMTLGREFVLGGLRRRIGEPGDLQAGYRQWYAEVIDEHDRMMIHMLEEFQRRGVEIRQVWNEAFPGESPPAL